jgi:hypothetical protein
MDPGKLPDDNGFGCLATYLLNVFGVSLTFPGSGGVPGADVQFLGKEGFPSCPLCSDNYVFMDYAQFGGRGDTILTTDGNGEVTLTVTGKAQAVQIPETAEPWDREFSIAVYAQPQAETAQNLFGVFFTGLVSDPWAGLLTAVIEAIKANHWYLDTPIYPIRDWHRECPVAASAAPITPGVAPAAAVSPPCAYEGTASATVVEDYGNGAWTQNYSASANVQLELVEATIGPDYLNFKYAVVDGEANWQTSGKVGASCTFSRSGTGALSGNMTIVGAPDDLTYYGLLFIDVDDKGLCEGPNTGLVLPADLFINCFGDLPFPGADSPLSGSCAQASSTTSSNWTWDLQPGECNPSPDPVCSAGLPVKPADPAGSQAPARH